MWIRDLRRALAVSLAKELNLTLACLSRDSDLYVFCGGERLIA